MGMKMMDKLLNRVESIFKTVLSEEQASGFTPSASMDDIDGWDSLNFLSIIMGIENEFSIRIDGLDAAAMTSVPNILEYLKNV